MPGHILKKLQGIGQGVILIWSADQETLTYFLRGVFRPVYPKLPRCRGPSTVKLCWELSVALFRPVSAASREMMDPSKLAHRGKTWPVPSTWWSLQVINKHNTHTYNTHMLVSNTPCFEMLAYQTTNFSLGDTLLLLLWKWHLKLKVLDVPKEWESKMNRDVNWKVHIASSLPSLGI